MDHVVARASQAYRDNEVALDDGHLHEEHSVHHPVAAAVTASARSARNLHHVKSAKNLRTAAAVTVNLRDCGTISRILRQGRMFRSSQVMRYTSPRRFPSITCARPRHNLPRLHSLTPALSCCCSAAEIDRLGIRVNVVKQKCCGWLDALCKLYG